jgi:uncharacterized protein YecE (DUF72 family)
MMNLQWGEMTPEEKRRGMHEARKHFRFCVKIYKNQIREGR